MPGPRRERHWRTRHRRGEDRFHGKAVFAGRSRSHARAPARVRPRRPLQPAQDVPWLQTLFGLRSPQADRGMKMLAPASLDELLQSLAAIHVQNEKIPPVTLTALNRVVEHAPED